MLSAIDNKSAQMMVDSKHDYTVIILGCQVRNGVPSQMLVQRLDVARNFMSENETVMCVTTGGYGPNQPVSEARVGKDWLVQNNIEKSRIYLEDNSTNTRENLIFAHDIIIKEDLPRNVIIVSDGFHLHRAKEIAKELFDGVCVIPVQTRPVIAIPTYWVREWFALTRDYISAIDYTQA